MNAHRSPALKAFLYSGVQLRGILATTAAGDYRPADPEITCRIVDRERVLGVLCELRPRRLAALQARAGRTRRRV